MLFLFTFKKKLKEIAKRNIEYATTVSFEKRAQKWDREQMVVDVFQQKDSIRLQKQLKTYSLHDIIKYLLFI
jgi:hypothetical protein